MALPLFCVLTKIIKFNSTILFLLLFIFIFFSVCGAHYGKYFFTGCLSAVLFNKYEIKNDWIRIIVFLLGIASLISSFFISGDYYGNPVFISISTFFLSLVLSKPVSLSNKLFIYCGETSYSIYLCHIILMVCVSYLVYLLFGVVDINSYTAILIYSISALLIAVISFFSYKYIEYP
ncbi:acyltransferase family protein [Candidatus Williamhamiltonella defendens]|uniref:Acyltransferase 3 domain-containing protein n=1 Tax=Hamiltonella defensa subsp. Acyrthosiphon pisum (strain 5AT) TaxID=572265 RepID=C4K4B2_HAMD5|nr:hypothetical protein HDEF_0667 [Candidatus Hamiltonella defensa 5AT (Acyrthosiphon pisum)]